MKNFLYLSAIVLLCSCNTEKKETNQTLIKTPTGLAGLQKAPAATPVVAAETAKSDLIFNPPHGQPGHNCDIAVGAPLNKTAPTQAQPQQPVTVQQTTTATQPQQLTVNAPATVNASGKRLNPKHGEPGHRCDIAIGAPLDSKPVQTTVVSTPTPVVNAPEANKTAEAKNGTKLNPKHGEPGHRCDIAVGAPLT